MKQLVPLFVIASLTVSCTRYQYLTISSASENVQKKTGSKFVAAYDSLTVDFDFKGVHMPLGIKITNKSGRAFIVDWKRSSIVINGHGMEMMPEEPIRRVLGSSILPGGPADTNGSHTAANALMREQTIPARSSLEKEPLKVITRYIKVPESLYIKKVVAIGDRKRVHIKEAAFTEGDSPLHFRTFLTLIDVGEKRDARSLEHAFYVSGLTTTETRNKGDDRPQLSRNTVAGGIIFTVVTTVAITGVVVVAIGKAVANQENEEEN